MGSSKQDSQIVTFLVLFSHWKYIRITVLLLFLQFLLPYDQFCLEINTSNIN